jgi:FkbM family methyltransferase
MCVGIVAKFVASKYPDGTIVDIGANIGDTAAIIATYSSNKLILVEPSEYFCEILRRNVRQFPNEVVVRKTMVSTGRNMSGNLHHWGGTASFHEEQDGQEQVRTERLLDVADKNTRFIKIDTDGYDVEILTDSIEWLSVSRPTLLFENGIRNSHDLIAVNTLLDRLMKIGYEHFIVWDDPGFHLVSTTSVEVLKDLNRYLCKRIEHGAPSICNYDVLCVHRRDEDIYNAVREWYRTY